MIINSLKYFRAIGSTANYYLTRIAYNYVYVDSEIHIPNHSHFQTIWLSVASSFLHTCLCLGEIG